MMLKLKKGVEGITLHVTEKEAVLIGFTLIKCRHMQDDINDLAKRLTAALNYKEVTDD